MVQLLQTIHSFATGLIRFVRTLGHEFVDRGCQKSAAALTYMTLFALVPLITVSYSMFSIVPAFSHVGDQLRDLIFSNLVPESSLEVQQYLSDFSSQARDLTSFGVLFLIATAYLMLTNIERTFNSIWGIKHARKGLSSFLLYWAVLSIGPLMLGAGLVVSTYLFSIKMFVDEHDIYGFGQTLFRLLPLLMTSAAFTLLFAAVPNCRVPIRAAFIGGVLSALCFELFKALFGAIVANTSFKPIYGAFAVVPLFLLWINIFWTIVLSGSLFVRTLAERSYLDKTGSYTDMSATLACLNIFRTRLLEGKQVTDKDCVKTGIGIAHWQRLRGKLLAKNWIAVTDNGNYVLSRNLNTLSLWHVAELVDMPLREQIPQKYGFNGEPAQWYKRYLDRHEHIRAKAQSQFADTLEDLFATKQA